MAGQCLCRHAWSTWILWHSLLRTKILSLAKGSQKGELLCIKCSRPVTCNKQCTYINWLVMAWQCLCRHDSTRLSDLHLRTTFVLELNEREENIHLSPINPFVSTAPHVAKLESVHHFILSHNKMDLNSLANSDSL